MSGYEARCVCCSRTSYEIGMARVDRGPIHFDCWEEHHSDPSGVWPPEHECGATTNPQEGKRSDD